MGQYGNQPDFGTSVDAFDTIGTGVFFQPSAIYVGQTDSGTCELTVWPVGNDPLSLDYKVTIRGIKDGTVLPIVVIKIDDNSGIQKGNVLLYR